jgi:hypothetical protein
LEQESLGFMTLFTDSLILLQRKAGP